MRKIIITIVIITAILAWGLLVRPPVVGGKFTSPWGLRFSTDRLFHPGSDIALPIGAPVFPIAGGKVRVADFNERHGNFMIIDHLPGIESRYLHFDTMNSSAGDTVNHRTVIGTVGNTGNISTGPHIHWEIRVFNIALPAYLICLSGRILQKAGVHKMVDRLLANNVQQ